MNLEDIRALRGAVNARRIAPSTEQFQFAGMPEDETPPERLRQIINALRRAGRSEEIPSLSTLRAMPQALYYDPRSNSLAYHPTNPDPLNFYRITSPEAGDWLAAQKTGDLPLQFPDPAALFDLNPADLAQTIEAERVKQWEPGGRFYASLPAWRQRHGLPPLEQNPSGLPTLADQMRQLRRRSLFGNQFLEE